MFVAGEIYRRRDLHNRFGGQQQGGISTPAKAPFVMLITGDTGSRYGYVDEWSRDGFFLYTGEGQRGPMRFVAGNKTIRDHEQEGKSLHLFEQRRKDRRMLQYIGEMVYVGHEIRPAPDRDKCNAVEMEMRLRGSEISRALSEKAACERFSRISLAETKLLADTVCTQHEFILENRMQRGNELP